MLLTLGLSLFRNVGWMMWYVHTISRRPGNDLSVTQYRNYSLSNLGGGTKLVMYDGSPLSPLSILFDLVDKYQVTALGISPRYLQVLDTNKYLPNQHHSLKSLKALFTAGSVLKAELYDWIYDNLGKDVFIYNGTGGTDVSVIHCESHVSRIADNSRPDLQPLYRRVRSDV